MNKHKRKRDLKGVKMNKLSVGIWILTAINIIVEIVFIMLKIFNVVSLPWKEVILMPIILVWALPVVFGLIGCFIYIIVGGLGAR